MPVWLSILVVAAFSWLLIGLTADSLLRLVYIIASWRECPRHAAPDGFDRDTLAVVIPAHNEADVIEETLVNLLQEMHPAQVFVIADNCTDDTAALAREVGVQVWQRQQTDDTGKGAALRWFVRAADQALEAFSYVLVLDADSLVGPSFFSSLMLAVAQGVPAAQCFARSPTQSSPVALLAGYSEFLSHRVDDVARQRLGWSAPLRGRGMVFDRMVLKSMVGDLRTRVEDVEFSLLLADRDISIEFIQEAVLTDAKPPRVAAATRQRARWLQGQRQVWRAYHSLILHLLFDGRLEYVSLVFATMVKPKTLLLLLKALWLAAAVVMPAQLVALRWGVGGAAGLALLIDVTYYLLGLRLVENPIRYAKALALAPLYLLVWLGSLGVSWLSRSPWLRAAPD